MNRFAGRTALVTGGTAGIGFATAKAFLEEGARVAITGRRPDAGRDAERRLRAVSRDVRYLRADMSKGADVRNAVRRTVESFGGIDILFNNAGLYPQKPAEEVTEREWDRLLAVNLKGYFPAAKAVIPHMRGRGGGVIVNNCSVSGHVAVEGESAYAASKGAPSRSPACSRWSSRGTGSA